MSRWTKPSRNKLTHSSKSVATLNKSSGSGIQSKISRNVPRKDLLLDTQPNYLQSFNTTLHGPLHDQPWAKSNVQKFHTSTQYFINQCIICKEGWPIKRPVSPSNSYTCARCIRDKTPKAFSVENSMIPGQIPRVTELDTSWGNADFSCLANYEGLHETSRAERLFWTLYKTTTEYKGACTLFA